jgi:HEAT repeat protein
MLQGIFGWEFDWPEFLFGLAVGAALAGGLVRILPLLLRLGRWLLDQWKRLGESLTVGATDRFRTDLIARAETLHLARAIFTLDEVIVPPRLLVPPPSTDPTETEPFPEEMLGVVPSLPDWTLFSSFYRSPTFTVLDALKSGVNFMITGEPGSGKTTALAYLAVQCARREEAAGPAAQLMPVLVHAADLRLGGRTGKDPLEPLLSAAQRTASTAIVSRLPGFLRLQFRLKRALLLLDGLDELTQEEMPPYAEWLRELLQAFPETRIVAAGPTTGYDGLARAGLSPVTIAPWTQHEQRAFLARWADSWTQLIAPTLPKTKLGEVDPALIGGWLIAASRTALPMELMLRTWAGFAGDARGRTLVDGLESYLTRFLSPDERPLAESAASNWINERQGAVPERALQRGAQVNDLVEAGILVRRADGRLSFFHPLIGAYLAARAMGHAGLSETVVRPGWAPAESAMQFFAAWGDVAPLVQSHLQTGGDALESGIFACAPWLRDSPPKAPWRGQVLRALGTLAQDPRRPYGLRLRAAQALVTAAEPSVSILFRRLLASEAPTCRALAALSLGAIRDEESAATLTTMVNEDRDLQVRQAACLALAAIGTEAALETLGQALLSGEEAVRLAAAEALACHPDEGYSMLREAAELDNLLTRRAAVFGLARVPEPWVPEILEKVQVNDTQWVVRGAAAEANERLRKSPWKIRKPVRDFSELPWLVAFAARVGSAMSMGTSEEKMAALEALEWADTPELSLDLSQALASPEPRVRDKAFETLWRQAASGLELSSPAQAN